MGLIVLRIVVGALAGLLLAWLVLLLALLVARPKGGLLKEALRLLPDVSGCCTAWRPTPGCPEGSASGWACCSPTWPSRWT